MSVQLFACPECGVPTMDVRHGKELEVFALEVSGVSEPRLVEVRRNVLKQNDVIARVLREQFRSAGVFVVSLVSSPGAGKTMFLEKTLTQLQPRYRVAALVGDLATENDAVRLARSKAPVKQITTGTLCHLEAAMVQNALSDWDLHSLDFLIYRERGKPGLSVFLRSRRKSSPRIDVGDGRRRQAAEVSDNFQ